MQRGPLQHRFKTKYLAPVPLEEKQSVLDAEADVARAQMAWEKSVYDVGESRVTLAVAKNDLDKERLEVSSCKERSREAKRCRDTSRMDRTATELEQARKRLAIAKAHLAHVKAQHKYVKARRARVREELRVAEAKLQLERAIVAEKHGIRPPGPGRDKFVAQLEQRQRQAAALADREARKLEEANRRRGAWIDLGGKPEPAPAGPPEPAEPAANSAPPAEEPADDSPAPEPAPEEPAPEPQP